MMDSVKVVKKHLLKVAIITALPLCVVTGRANAQRGGTGSAQRFVMQVQDMMDMGYINENQSYTSTGLLDINELEEGKTAEYNFRIRTNEPFRIFLSISDAEGSEANNLLQVALPQEKGADFKDITETQLTLVERTDKSADKVFTLRYRSKPGNELPESGKDLRLLLTASYP